MCIKCWLLNHYQNEKAQESQATAHIVQLYFLHLFFPIILKNGSERIGQVAPTTMKIKQECLFGKHYMTNYISTVISSLNSKSYVSLTHNTAEFLCI